MKNITLSVDEELVKEGRRYAAAHNTSLNALVRDLLSKAVLESSENRVEECIGKMDSANGHSRRMKWKREDLYNV